jgi:hypothetical protein
VDTNHSSFFDNVSIYFDQSASFTEYPKGLLDDLNASNGLIHLALRSIQR